MTDLAVSLRRIANVRPHPNADRLEIADVEGLAYQFVVPKGRHRAGDAVAYFPIDALLPAELADRLGVRTYLAGRAKDRVKTAKLRGEISQGLVADPAQVRADLEWQPGVNYAEALGVTKWEPPPIPCAAGRLAARPPGVAKYDIESADNHPDVAALLMDERVHVTEKVEGSNWWASAAPDGTIAVGQHKHRIEPVAGAEHDFWKVAREQGLLGFLRTLQETRFAGRLVTLRGEYAGPNVQKNIYGFKANRVLLFDLDVDGRALAPPEFVQAVDAWDAAARVPTIAYDVTLRDWLAGRPLRHASDGKSLLGPCAREGIVVKPMRELRHPEIGRLFLKQRSPEYLAATDF